MKKELKKLSRGELLNLLLEVTEENEKLREENMKLREECDNKLVLMNNAGSIAEASLKLTKVFEEAQKAANIYLDSVKKNNKVSM